MTVIATKPHLMIFDLTRHLHVPGYLAYLIEAWRQRPPTADLSIVVWHTFLRDHTDVVQLAKDTPHGNIHFVTLTVDERREKVVRENTPTRMAINFHALLKAGERADYAALYDWELMGRYATQLKATHSFILYLDPFLPLLASGFTAPTPVSGIYFNPSFHYADFQPAAQAAERLKAPRKKFVLARALRHPQLDTLFCLDPLAMPAIEKFEHGAKAQYLADPVRLAPPAPDRMTTLRAELGIAAGRRVLLLFGHLAARKGIAAILAALQELPLACCQQLCLLLVGSIDPAYRSQLDPLIAAIRATRPVQIVCQYGFFPEADVSALFGLSDVVLATYHKHAGSSGVLLHAAAAGKPVLSAPYGLMGEWVHRYGLGLVVDPSDRQALAEALTRCVEEASQTLCSREGQAQLVAEHHADRFGATIFGRLLDGVADRQPTGGSLHSPNF